MNGVIMNKEEVFIELNKKGLLKKIPSHEIEEKLFDLEFDAFDSTKRRDGYPKNESGYYKDFSPEQAGREKVILDRLFQADLEERFVFWKITTPTKPLIIMLFFLSLAVASFGFWVFMVVTGHLDGAYLSLISLIVSIFVVWHTHKNRINKEEATTRFNKSIEALRTEGYEERQYLGRVLEKHEICVNF